MDMYGGQFLLFQVVCRITNIVYYICSRNNDIVV